MISTHLSNGGGKPGMIELEFNRKVKITRCLCRRKFLQDCMDEQVLPRSAPNQLRKEDSPFSESARVYLKEACEDLANKMRVLINSGNGVVLPQHLVEEIQRESSVQRDRLKIKLNNLCENSAWKDVGRADLVLNLSSKQFTDTELQALSLGLKFDTGLSKGSYTDYLTKNYRWLENDVDKGFKQGVLSCYIALASEGQCAIPKRYIEALNNIRKCKEVIITHADKGGGVIIMNKADYVNKMMDLLGDTTTYEKMPAGYAEGEASKFKSDVRKVLNRTEKGKKLLYLLEEAPSPPRMRGLPKTHKPGIPMRPITSGIGSAPHRLAKRLAKPLSAALGLISGAHLKNSSDLIERLNRIDFNKKKLASFDVKALFTNVPVNGAIKAVERAIEKMDDIDLMISKRDYIELVSMCVRFGAFTFENEEYRQHRGLAMGSPLSAVMACLHMETLETDKYTRIIGRGASWFRYVDDVMVVIPENTNIGNKLRMLNEVDVNIQFTIEEEENGRLPFLDTVIWRSGHNVKFSVYRKPTNKDDFIHYLSAHSKRTKTGVVIGFFLRAIRICSKEYIEEEFRYIMEAFKRLKYPEGLIIKLREKAFKIMERRKDGENNVKNDYLIVPHSKYAHIIDKFLQKTGIKVSNPAGQKIGDMIKSTQKGINNNKKSIVYEIPCNGCSAVYYGETGLGLEKRLREHKADVRHHRSTNSLVLHIEKCQHLPNWNGARIVQKGMNKVMRKTVEAAYITTGNVINHREGFVCLAKMAGKLVVTSSKGGTRVRASSATADGWRGRSDQERNRSEVDTTRRPNG